MPRARHLWNCVAALALAACATPSDNAPPNRPLSPPSTLAPAAQPGSPPPPDPSGGANVIALSLSGGGMRAAAFAYGVLQALLGDGPTGMDVFDELTFISSVSGGSLTAAYFGLHGREGFVDFRDRVLDQDFERELRMSMLSPVNIARMLAGGLNDRSNLAHTLHREVFGQATFAGDRQGDSAGREGNPTRRGRGPRQGGVNQACGDRLTIKYG